MHFMPRVRVVKRGGAVMIEGMVRHPARGCVLHRHKQTTSQRVDKVSEGLRALGLTGGSVSRVARAWKK